jgi:4-aminobutyrate aminotransferase
MASKIVSRAKKVLTPALHWATQLEIVKAEGVYVQDKQRKKYLDFTSGIATTNIGHCPPRVIQAAKRQLESLIHAGGVYYYESIVRLGEELAEIAPGNIDMFFFSNSGAEAVEGAIKLARYTTKRPGIIAFRGAFHGRTLGCVSMTTSNVKYRRNYGPLLPSVHIVPFPYTYRFGHGNDPEASSAECLAYLDEVFKHDIPPEEVAAILIEPIQGEGGYVPAPQDFLIRLRQICDQHGILLIFDEVQSGFGRTARWFACEHYGVVPDIIAIAKGIASGFPLSAVGARREIMSKWSPGAHGTTFGGNPVSCAAAIATIQTIKQDELLEQATELSAHVFSRLNDMKNDFAIIGDVRGYGYMIGIEFIQEKKEPNREVVEKIRSACEKNGLLLISCGLYGNVIRFIPPLVATRAQLDQGLEILAEAIKKATPQLV